MHFLRKFKMVEKPTFHPLVVMDHLARSVQLSQTVTPDDIALVADERYMKCIYRGGGTWGKRGQ